MNKPRMIILELSLSVFSFFFLGRLFDIWIKARASLSLSCVRFTQCLALFLYFIHIIISSDLRQFSSNWIFCLQNDASRVTKNSLGVSLPPTSTLIRSIYIAFVVAHSQIPQASAIQVSKVIFRSYRIKSLFG